MQLDPLIVKLCLTHQDRIPAPLLETILKSHAAKERKIERETIADERRKKWQDECLALSDAQKKSALDRLNAAACSLSSIIDLVCITYAVSKIELLSHRRTGYICRARQIAYYLCHKLTGASLPMIGRFINGRDHTTILYGVAKIKQELETNDGLAKEIADLTAILARR